MTEFISKTEVLRRTAISHSTLFREIRANRFPAPVKLTAGRVAWLASEVEEWAKERVAASRSQTEDPCNAENSKPLP